MRTIFAFAIVMMAASVAHAAPDITLSTVDEYERTAVDTFSITGIPVGQSAPQTKQYVTYFSSSSIPQTTGDACERAALMMMNRPGRWVLQINIDPSNATYASCRLVKAK